MQETEALLVIHHMLGFSHAKVGKLLESADSAQDALLRLPKDWEGALNWKRDLEEVEKKGVSLLAFTDTAYPAGLRELNDPPWLLYIKGRLPGEGVPGVAVVGTRQCTRYGKEMARGFGRDLASCGIAVVSGLARGIDTEAHEGALETGVTVAVLGSGLGHIYPPENGGLADRIAEKGALISEFPMLAKPEKYHFPKRNRLVSALSQSALLIEAPLESGAMITMELSLALKRRCFAIPGHADNKNFHGNHLLIKKQKAYLVEHAREIVAMVQPGWRIDVKKEPLPDIGPEEQSLIDCLALEELSMEELSIKTRLPAAKLSSLLMELVLKQMVQECPGKFYKRK